MDAKARAARIKLIVTDAGGGHGAVREASEFILAVQGQLEAAFAPYIEQR